MASIVFRHYLITYLSSYLHNQFSRRITECKTECRNDITFECERLVTKEAKCLSRKIYQFVAVRVGHKKLPLLPKCKLLVWLPIGPPVHQQLPLRGTALPQTKDNPYIGCADWTSGANGAEGELTSLGSTLTPLHSFRCHRQWRMSCAHHSCLCSPLRLTTDRSDRSPMDCTDRTSRTDSMDSALSDSVFNSQLCQSRSQPLYRSIAVYLLILHSRLSLGLMFASQLITSCLTRVLFAHNTHTSPQSSQLTTHSQLIQI